MILITGGAGYIGSHTNKQLNKLGYNTVVFDNLVYGHREFVKWGHFVLGDLSNIDQIRLVFQRYSIDAVVHFAAFAYVGESVKNPQAYYINNVMNTLNLLKVMNEFSCNKIIFSSTCATYGNPISLPISEAHTQKPINPYGRSKLMIEQILEDYSRAYSLNYVALRYFNAAGADLDGDLGELHDPETHLIPLVLNTALGGQEYVEVFGIDYDTHDGSCIRDYIHVTDLATAHIKALEYLNNGGQSDVFNLGNDQGFSVLEIIDTARSLSKKDITVKKSSRRAGDPPVLISDSAKARNVLKWVPTINKIDQIIDSALKWNLIKNEV